MPAQLSELIAAVDEGKGLSEIQPWDDYDETAAPVEVQEGEYNQESDVAPEHDTSAREDSRHYDESQEPSKESELSLQARDESEKPEEQELEGDEKLGGNGERAASAETGEVENESFENPDPQHDVQDPSKPEVGDDFPNEGAYDSEAPRTESSTTVAQANLEDEQEAEEFGNISDNDQVRQGVHGGHDEPQHATVESEYHETEDTSHGEYHETDSVPHGEYDEAQGTTVQDEYHGEGEGAPHGEYHDTDDYYENYEAEPDVNAPEQFEDNHPSEPHESKANLEKRNEGQSSNYSEENQSGEGQPNGALEDGELYGEEFNDEDGSALNGSAETNQDNTSHGVSESRPQDVAEPAGDVLGVSDDLSNPVKGITPVEEQAGGQVGSAELGDEENGSNTIPEDPDDWNFDEEEYTDVGATDTFEIADADPSFTDSHTYENVSTKRTREPEEEFEPDGGPSPDPKRRRSS